MNNNHAKVNFIKRFVSIAKDDQLVDIGGGTALISLLLHSEIGMTTPVVCIDPVQEMLDVAQKDGAITVKATAEEFLATKPDFPLKIVLMNGCVHHFTDRDLVFTKLAEYMPEDGVCIIANSSNAMALPLFKSAAETFSGILEDLDGLRELVQSKGLNCRAEFSTEPVEIDKTLWYDALRNRCISFLQNFSDEQLEQGIQELEEKYKGQNILKYNIDIKGLIISKKL